MADTEKKTAKYRFLVDTIKEKIKNGEYEPGERMESENTLSEQFGYSRQIVRQALSVLEQEGSLSATRQRHVYQLREPTHAARQQHRHCDDVYFRLYFSDDHPRH